MFGIRLDEPQWIEVPNANTPKGKAYIEAIAADIDKNTRLCVVLLNNPKDKEFIKKFLDEKGVPS